MFITREEGNDIVFPTKQWKMYDKKIQIWHDSMYRIWSVVGNKNQTVSVTCN